MKMFTLHARSFLVILAGLAMFAILAIASSGTFDPNTVKSGIKAWPTWAKATLFAGWIAYIAFALDTFGRFVASMALRLRKRGDHSPRREALVRFAVLSVCAIGMVLWRTLAPGMFPQPSNGWILPALLGAVLVPVAATIWDLGKSVP